MQTKPRTPEEIVDEMIKLFNRQEMAKNGKIPKFLRQLRPEAFPEMPFVHKKICAWVEAMIKRERCAETFKTWGTPQEIADHILKKQKDFVKNYTMTPSRFAKAVGVSLPGQSRVGPSGFFPCLPEPQNQLSSDVLE